MASVMAFAATLFVNMALSAENQGNPELSRAAHLKDQVDEMYQSRRYGDAIPLAEEVLAIRENALGADHPDTANSLDSLALLYDSMGNYAKAEPLYARALAIREKALGADHPDTANSLGRLATLHQSMGNYAKAEPLFVRALTIDEKALGPDHPDTGIDLNNLALIYRYMGDYARAEPLYTRALAIKEKALGADHPKTATSLNNLAVLYVAMGNYAKAEPLYARALAIREKALGADHLDTANSLDSLAVLYRSMGNYAKAEPLLVRGLAIREKALGADHPETAISLGNLAGLYDSLGNYAKAEPLYARALAIREKALGGDHPDTAQSLSNLAGLYESLGDYAKAEPLYFRALAIREKALGVDHPTTANSLNDLAVLYDSLGSYGKAEPLYARALAINEKALGADHPTTANSLDNLAILQIDEDRPIEALRLAVRVEQAYEKTLANVLSFSSEQQRSEFQKIQRPFNIPATLGDASLAARTLLHWKGVVLDSVLEDRAVARSAGEKGLAAQLDEMKSLKAQLFKLTLEAPKDTTEEALQSRAQLRKKLTEEVENIEAALARNVAALGQSRRALEATPEQVQAALRPQEALIEFVRYSHYLGKQKWEPRYGAVIFSLKGPLQWVGLGAVEDIEKRIRLYQKSARGKTDESTLQATLQGLHGKLWAPIERALPANTKSIILSPDAELNFVSFATLLGEDDQFLAEKYSLRYVSSGRDLLRTPPKEKEVSSAQSDLELYGNPAFLLAGTQTAHPLSPAPSQLVAMRDAEIRDFRGVTLAPLGGTAAECQSLAKVARQIRASVKIKTKGEATEASLQKLQSPFVLHLATHGFFLPEVEVGDSATGILPSRQIPKGKLVNPMHRSGLALAGAQDTLAAWGRGEIPPSENDGILTAEEVGTLNLAGTWLVTLSACETGSGQARAGEGVLGLRRGFVQAGAQNLLMTLWPISDETTVQIMLEFYQSAFANKDAPESLIGVQRKWLVKLRQEKGLLSAVNLAGPFIMSSQGKSNSSETKQHR